jgi:hypothetical protein
MPPGVIALNHFEFGIDDAEINLGKLQLLEELSRLQACRFSWSCAARSRSQHFTEFYLGGGSLIWMLTLSA